MRTLPYACFASLVALTLAIGCQNADPVSSKNSNGSGTDTETGTGGSGGSGTTTGTGGGTSTGTGGAGGATTTTTTTGTGGAPGCAAASQCPGKDTDCRTRPCNDGVCGETVTAAGTPLSQQTPGDCQKAACDGNGGETSAPDDTDIGDDGKECTSDACQGGTGTNTAAAVGTSCSQNGGKLCNAASNCVECIAGTDCASGVCDAATFTCLPAKCGDSVKNGAETDVDCGGGTCEACGPDLACVADSDCKGGSCVGGKCAPTCTDGVKNGAETDVDCGGASCGSCDFGQTCAAVSDCSTGACAGTCACAPGCACNHLVLSEIRSRGLGGTSDEFIEIYNPTGKPVVLGPEWKVESRSASAASYAARYTGDGTVTVPAHGHALLKGKGYAGAVAADATLSSGITDAGSVRLTFSDVPVDAVCYQYNASTLASLTDPAKGYTCAGAPVSNLPHNDGTSAKSNSDASIERKPGAGAGNCGDTGDSATDWQPLAPAAPQDALSAPTP